MKLRVLLLSATRDRAVSRPVPPVAAPPPDPHATSAPANTTAKTPVTVRFQAMPGSYLPSLSDPGHNWAFCAFRNQSEIVKLTNFAREMPGGRPVGPGGRTAGFAASGRLGRGRASRRSG